MVRNDLLGYDAVKSGTQTPIFQTKLVFPIMKGCDAGCNGLVRNNSTYPTQHIGSHPAEDSYSEPSSRGPRILLNEYICLHSKLIFQHPYLPPSLYALMFISKCLPSTAISVSHPFKSSAVFVQPATMSL